MGHILFFIAFGYLSGSILFAYVFARLFNRENLIADSPDKNPGAANAFVYGGFWCGVCTLLGDIFKGFLPVHLFAVGAAGLPDWSIALVLAAPVLGHAFSVFHKSQGGKGIAVTFGCLLGLFPYIHPFLMLAGTFIFLSTVVKISPHFYRTLASYAAALLIMLAWHVRPGVWLGFLIITAIVFIRFWLSSEQRERIQVKLLWKY